MQITPEATAASPAAAAPRGGSAVNADFQTFLRMLTVQMRNQDPLNPMEATDFAVQLATFAGVEQQTRSNQLLETMASRLGQSSMAALAGWIGMEARVPGAVRFDGAPVTLVPSVPDGADRAELVVRDRTGREVAREPLRTGDAPIDWVGTGSDGRPLPPGDYTLVVEGFAGPASVGERAVRSYAAITEARLTPSGSISVVLAGGTVVDSAQVDALRRPGG